MKKRILSFALAFALFIALVPMTTAMAAVTFKTYINENENYFKVEISNYIGETDKITLPGIKSDTLSVFLLDSDSDATAIDTVESWGYWANIGKVHFPDSIAGKKVGYVQGVISTNDIKGQAGSVHKWPNDSFGEYNLRTGVHNDIITFWYDDESGGQIAEASYTISYILLTPSMADTYLKTGKIEYICHMVNEETYEYEDTVALEVEISGLKELILNARGNESNSTAPTPTPTPAATVTTSPTANKVLVDGKEVAFDAYNINDENYFKLRDVAFVLNGTRVQFNAALVDGAINIYKNTAYEPNGSEMQSKGEGSKEATLNKMKILIDGVETELTAYLIDGNNYFKMRELAQTFDFFPAYDGTITIDTTKPYGG
ncbi:MAG: hypothetical protein FWG36_09720 [Oscillospiraceae bacterium]|nr:hypothetical protein [Oscillospiraceae bacterium]